MTPIRQAHPTPVRHAHQERVEVLTPRWELALFVGLVLFVLFVVVVWAP